MQQPQLYDPNKRFVVPTYTSSSGTTEPVRLFKDIFDVVMEDKWAFIVVWGEQRTGKSTLALWIPYFFWRMLDPNLSENEIWERVYSSVVFNLSQIIYKIEDPNMLRVWDYKKQHFRIPVIMWDDFGAHSNKAVTQHEVAWDHFKGGFDILGTKFGIIVVTMTTPDEPTLQIERKYTHEVFIVSRGTYKYDRVIWQQDYHGWAARHSKDWQQMHTFSEIPWERFKPYNDLRLSLADEVVERIKDAMADRTGRLLNRLNDNDMLTLEELIQAGPMSEYRRKEWFIEQRERTETKLKAHQLVTVVRRGTAHHLDITSFGIDVLNKWKKVKGAEAETVLAELKNRKTQQRKEGISAEQSSNQ